MHLVHVATTHLHNARKGYVLAAVECCSVCALLVTQAYSSKGKSLYSLLNYRLPASLPPVLWLDSQHRLLTQHAWNQGMQWPLHFSGTVSFVACVGACLWHCTWQACLCLLPTHCKHNTAYTCFTFGVSCSKHDSAASTAGCPYCQSARCASSMISNNRSI